MIFIALPKFVRAVAVPAMTAPENSPNGNKAARPSLIEVGWVVAGRLDAVDAKALREARTRVLEQLRLHFPAYEWRMPAVTLKEVVLQGRTPPTTLLDHGAGERDLRRWDYALVVTDTDLESHYKPFALGTPAKTINVAVLSTARIDPAASEDSLSQDDRVETLARRLTALALHLFGHLNDLPHDDDPDDFMFDLRTVHDLDAMTHFSEDDLERLRDAFDEVADLRLEETGAYRGKALLFYLRASWQNRGEIAAAVTHVKPWQFPFRLSKLTTAAASTLVLLVITAEAWDLGMSQPALRVLVLSLLALGGTSLYILYRQQLLVRRRALRLSEQRVVANVSIVLAVLLGMLTTYALLFVTTFALTRTLFGNHLVEGWAASLDGDITLGNYFILSGFVAALGLMIGALGASFEEQTYFRHLAYVDEET